MATIEDTLSSIIQEAATLQQLMRNGDDLEDARATLEQIDSQLDDLLEEEPK